MVEGAVAIIEDPASLVATVTKNFMAHKTEVVKLIADVVEDMHNGDYYDAGKNFGEVQALLLFGNEPLNLELDLVNVDIKGIAKGTGGFLVGFY